MKSVVGLFLAVLMLAISAPALAETNEGEFVDIDVMSQNLYIGADLDRVLQGESPAAVLETALATDYPGRSEQIAETIGANQPDLVGLQEVAVITLFTASGQILLQNDYLTVLMGELAQQGQAYAVSSWVVNSNVVLPVDLANGIFAQVTDRDVIIHNTATTTVANPSGENFSTNFAFELGGFPVEFTRGYTGVDATVDGQTFRVVNTHLEVENAPCLTDSGLVICQDAQATELIDVLYNEVYPTILVGDFNAAPGETAYQTIVDRGYADTWNSDTESGFTCCQPELLDNEVSELSHRIDHLFVRRRGTKVVSAATTVLGDEPESRTDAGLWSSDHGAPFAELTLRITVDELPGGEPDPNDNGDD